MKKFLYAALLVAGVAAMLAPPVTFAADDEKPFTIHGEVRWRGEMNNNASDFENTSNSPANGFENEDNAFSWPYRVRIAAEGRFTHNVTAYMEFQNTGVGGDNIPYNFGNDTVQNPRFIGDYTQSTTRMYQGNITINHLWSDSFNIRFGRQEIVAGNEFLLGDEDFYGGIAHDGITAWWDLKKVHIMAWLTRPWDGNCFFCFNGDVTPDLQENIGSGESTVDFFGGYATWMVHKDQTVDVYAMNINDRGMGGRWQTWGGRYSRDNMDKSQLVWNIEIALQSGDMSSAFVTGGPDDVKASGKASEGMIGWNWHKDKANHRVYGKYEYASGDKNDTADKNEGFMPLYGEQHNRAGHGDWFHVAAFSTDLGRNSVGGGLFDSGGLKAFAVGYQGTFSEKHQVGVEFWDYSLAEDNKDYYDSIAAPTPDDHLGNAIDLWYGFDFTKNVTFEASLSQLQPDDGLTHKDLLGGSVPDDTVTRLYGQVRLRF